jgi:hypothetical protein
VPGHGPDTINLRAHRVFSLAEPKWRLFRPRSNARWCGDFRRFIFRLAVIRSAIGINGNGSLIRHTSSAPDFAVFTINQAGNLNLTRIALFGTPHEDESFGNSVIVNAGHLTLSRSLIANSAGDGLDNIGIAFVVNSTFRKIHPLASVVTASSLCKIAPLLSMTLEYW